MTSSEIAFAIFIAKHNLPMAVGDEFGLLTKKMWCSTVPVAHPGGEKNTNYRFSRFFVRAVPLFRSLMLTPMYSSLCYRHFSTSIAPSIYLPFSPSVDVQCFAVKMRCRMRLYSCSKLCYDSILYRVHCQSTYGIVASSYCRPRLRKREHPRR